MKWAQGSSRYYQFLVEDDRYTCVKWCAAGNAGGVDKYWAAYKASANAPLQYLCLFTTDVNVAKKAAERHYGAMQRRAA